MNMVPPRSPRVVSRDVSLCAWRRGDSGRASGCLGPCRGGVAEGGQGQVLKADSAAAPGHGGLLLESSVLCILNHDRKLLHSVCKSAAAPASSSTPPSTTDLHCECGRLSWTDDFTHFESGGNMCFGLGLVPMGLHDQVDLRKGPGHPVSSDLGKFTWRKPALFRALNKMTQRRAVIYKSHPQDGMVDWPRSHSSGVSQWTPFWLCYARTA